MMLSKTISDPVARTNQVYKYLKATQRRTVVMTLRLSIRRLSRSKDEIYSSSCLGASQWARICGFFI